MDGIGIAGLIASLVGLVPLCAGWLIWVERFRKGRRVLGFTPQTPVDVIVATSAVGKSRTGQPVLRPMTGIGSVQGVASCARAISKFYPKNEIVVHFSGYLRNRLSRDTVIFGGPKKNQLTDSLLNFLVERYHVRKLLYDDDACNLVIVDRKEKSLEVLDFDPRMKGGVPQIDYGLCVACTRSDTAGQLSRWILISGFTTYGTAAAAEYFFSDLPKVRRSALRSLGGGQLGHDFVVIVKIEFSGTQHTTVEPVYLTSLSS